jgi:flagellar hook-associated protein 1 FlgK
MFSSLSIGASALYAAQRAVEVAAHNVANATNTSYTRQRLTTQASTPTYGTAGAVGDGDRGTGVSIVSLSRLRDRLADVAYRTEAGTAGASAARSETLTHAVGVLGNYGDGAPEALSAFVASWDQLATNPSDSAARTSVLSAGSRLADSLNSAATKLDDVSNEVTLRVGDDVGELNGLLSTVAKLNASIVKAQTEQREPNDLLDQRDAALDRIAALTGARVDQQTDGSVTLSTSNGTVLVQGQTAASLTASTTNPVTVTLGGNPVALAGEIGGYVSAATTDLPAYRAQLDAVAVQLRDVMNTAHRAGVGSDGSTGLDFFTGTGAGDLAVNSALTPAQIGAGLLATHTDSTGATVPGAPSGDGSGALSIAAALRNVRDGNNQNVGDLLRAVGSRIGQAATDAARNAKTGASSLTSAQAARASTDGVSVDEEMVDLVKFQHSYEAAARVISIADGMLDKLINGMVR